MAQQIQLRRDTAANWASANPTPARGEPCYATDTGVLKIGDGATAYSALPRYGDAFGAAAAAQSASQPLDADLTAIAALTTTATGRSVLAAADAAAIRTIAESAPLASPTFTGTPAAPTAATATNTTQVATTAYVKANRTEQAAADAGQYASYDVIMAGTGIDPTGVADSTVAIQAKFDSIPVGGSIFIPPGRYRITDTIDFTVESITIHGSGCNDVWTGNISETPGSLAGSIFYVDANGINAFAALGRFAIDAYNFGVMFDTGLTSTGHGFYFKNEAGQFKSGLTSFNWDNIAVWGHDGDHYGLWLGSPLHGSTNRFRSYGGGCIYTEATDSQQNVGNIVHTAPLNILSKSGTADGYAHNASAGETINFIVYIRPQCNMTSGSATQRCWNDRVGAADPSYNLMIHPDFEPVGNPTEVADPVIAPGTTVIGSPYIAQAVRFLQSIRLGYEALGESTVIGTAVGHQALKNNTTGDQHTALGWRSLLANTTGNYNTGLGYETLTANTTGYNNTAVGRRSGAFVTTGYQNTFVGALTGTQTTPITTGFANVLVGYEASHSGGSQLSRTVAVGQGAVVGANHTTAIGASASATAAGAVAIGRDSSGTSATSTVANRFVLGTANHTVQVPGRLNVATRTPSGTADSQGTVGDVTWDDDYVYVKTSAGWKRSALSTF